MSISAISSSNPQTQSSLLQNLIQQSRTQFQQLGQDLQSGNLSAAQQDFTQLTSSATNPASAGSSSTSLLTSLLSGSSGSTASSSALQTNQDLTSLASDLQSGNLSAAQKAYASLKQDLQASTSSASEVQGHHHHHHGGSNFQNPAPASTSDPTANPSSGSSSSGFNLSSLFSNISALPLASLSLAA